MGFDPPPPATSETAFYTSPTLRVRHYYLQAEKDAWKLIAGQYWTLFGWQAAYVLPSLSVAPAPGVSEDGAHTLVARAFDPQGLLQPAG